MATDYTSIIASAAVSGLALGYLASQYTLYKDRFSEISSLCTISNEYAIKEAKNKLKIASFAERIFCMGERCASRKFLKIKGVF